MASTILGPCSPVPCDNPVVITCVVEDARPTYVNHPAFTNNSGDGVCQGCEGTSAPQMVVFCSAEHLTAQSVFVGVIASDPTRHGGHAHVAVFIRGAVTMACNLANLKDVCRPMATLAFSHEQSCRANFAGIGQRLLAPNICLADDVNCNRVVGILVEKGRMPSNEVRVLLRPGITHRGSSREVLQRMLDKHEHIEEVVGHLTLKEAASILKAPGTLLAGPTNDPEMALVFSRIAAMIRRDGGSAVFDRMVT